MTGVQATLADAGEDSDYRTLTAPPTVTNFLRQTYIAVRELAFNWEKYPYDHEFTVRMFTDGLPSLFEVCFVLATTLSFILFRIIFDPLLRAWLQRAKFRECDAQKFPECFFRSIYYVCITSYGVYAIYLSGKHVFFQEPCTCFEMNPDLDQYFSQPMPTDLLILYGVQFSYYLANVYMVTLLDTVKKDTGMMLVHHIVTITLIGFSYLARFFLRIYMFPLRMLHATNWCVYLKRDHMIPRFYLPFNLLLLALVIMHHIWGWVCLV
ncbi:unnamed protein product [Schistocephalus solidus]|uniref:TLC domain-containing protein n=1 Tax=Schistocephalus solidus TaxID=70667 RepID=A0A183SS09_SCHSO|nr:unnamed protein product [Schistocephalus solidus]